MSSVLFYDPLCREPYDTRALGTRALGGTEATLTRVADALGAWVVQHNRQDDWERYRRPEPTLPGIGSVIVTREARALRPMHERYPQARLFLWLHDRVEPGSSRARRLAADAATLRDLAVTVVCVSDWLRERVSETLRGFGVAERVPTRRIYNPVDDALVPDGTAVDERKLVFFSSPNKGLAYTLDAFATLRRQMPDLRLVVGNPGYKLQDSAAAAGVEFLGPQPHARMLSEVRSALCTFFPNFVIPETFGLVFAESHAVGTPVLTHDCGAALEVLGDREEVLPLGNASRIYETLLHSMPGAWRRSPARLAAAAGLFEPYAARIRAWRQGGRPHVAPDPRFRLSGIAHEWQSLLAG
jgi:glycosyltransferase involved in cell wall biosynthesis